MARTQAASPRPGLEGVDAPRERGWRARVRRIVRLVTDPAGWSADRYQREDAMHFSAVQPETWRKK